MKLFNKLFFVSLFAWTLIACNTDIIPDNGYIETTQSDASTFVMQGYEDSKKGFNVFNPEGSSIIRKSKFPRFPERSVQFLGKRTKRSVQKKAAHNTYKAGAKG